MRCTRNAVYGQPYRGFESHPLRHGLLKPAEILENADFFRFSNCLRYKRQVHMAIRMAKLTRTPTGLWTSRKVIPADGRADYGKREEKPTWPASLTQGQARAEFGAWLTAVEERIAALRSSSHGPNVNLTERQSRALAGKWYEQLEAEYGDDPGDEAGWEIQREQLYPLDGIVRATLSERAKARI